MRVWYFIVDMNRGHYQVSQRFEHVANTGRYLLLTATDFVAMGRNKHRLSLSHSYTRLHSYVPTNIMTAAVKSAINVMNERGLAAQRRRGRRICGVRTGKHLQNDA